MQEALNKEKTKTEFPLGAVPKRGSFPYAKKSGQLKGFKVEFRNESETDFVGEKISQPTYALIEERDSRIVIVDAVNTAYLDIWGGAMKLILDEILPFLNNKEGYDWVAIKKPILDFWHKKQEADKQSDIANGGAGQWTSMNDFSMNCLMKFIAGIFGTKFELLKRLPDSTEYEVGIKSTDAFEQQITQMAFDEVMARHQVSAIVEQEKEAKTKAREVVKFIIEHSRRTPNLAMRDLLDPEYQDDVPLLSSEEEGELDGLWVLFEQVEAEIDGKQNLSKEERLVEKHDFWNSEIGKRLNQLNNRRVHGASISFAEREKRKRETAYKISKRLLQILISWGFDHKAIREGQREYFALYAQESWKREKQELNMRAMVKSGYSQIELFRDLMHGGWDSNSMTFLGVVIGIAISVLLSLFAILLSTTGIVIALGLSIGATALFLAFFLFAIKKFRKPLVRWSRETLEENKLARKQN